MDNAVVVINDNPDIDMSWAANDVNEAHRMVDWLKSNKINARCFNSLSDWEKWSTSEILKRD